MHPKLQSKKLPYDNQGVDKLAANKPRYLRG